MSTYATNVILALAFIAVGCNHSLALTGDVDRAEIVMQNPESMPKAWLVGRVDYQDAEEFCNGGLTNKPTSDKIPNFREEWLKIKNLYKNGDEIWLWSSISKADPFSQRGHEWANGYCLNRNGEIIYAFIIGKAHVN